MSKYKIWWTK